MQGRCNYVSGPRKQDRKGEILMVFTCRGEREVSGECM